MIGYVECHGTATPLGDPIEFAGLEKAFRETTQDQRLLRARQRQGQRRSPRCGRRCHRCHQDSVDAARMSRSHRCSTTHRPIRISILRRARSRSTTKLIAWPRGETPRMAGVSSFGVGGTNVHVVLEEGPVRRSHPSSHSAQIVVLSARSAAALEK